MKTKHTNVGETAPRAETHVDAKTLYSMGSLSKTMDIKKTKLYELMAAQKLKFIYVGARRYVTAVALAEFIQNLERESEEAGS
jgi:hypothetical protein